MDRIGVRELRQHASRYLERVRRGESLEVTDRGTPVALLVPVTGDRWDDLVARGLVRPASADLLAVEPVDAGASASAVLERIRDHER